MEREAYSFIKSLLDLCLATDTESNDCRRCCKTGPIDKFVKIEKIALKKGCRQLLKSAPQTVVLSQCQVPIT